MEHCTLKELNKKLKIVVNLPYNYFKIFKSILYVLKAYKEKKINLIFNFRYIIKKEIQVSKR